MTRTACLNAIYELAKRDERVVFIGTDLSPNTLLEFKRDFPERFFMCGVQEQNCIGLAAGLALEGYIPYVNNIASFLTRRAYEQIAIDICAHNLPVRLIGNGGGLVYAPLGMSHCAIEDIAIMRALPNMAVVNCADSEEMEAFMQSTLEHKGPIYIRLGKDNDPSINSPHFDIEYGAKCLKFSPVENSIFMIGTGIMSHILVKVLELMDQPTNIWHMPIIKPLSIPLWKDGAKPKLIVIAEEGIINGGLGSAVLEYLADNNIQIPVKRFGLPDAFLHHYGEREDLLETYGLTSEKMATEILKCL